MAEFIYPKLSSYERGLKILWNKVKWDIKTESKKSNKTLLKLKDSHRNEKCIVICNGPSLKSFDLKLIDNVFTFALNKFYLSFPNHSFRPSCLLAFDELIIKESLNYFKKPESPLFLSHKAHKYLKGTTTNATYLYESSLKGFVDNIIPGVYSGSTVTFIALQLAYYMGFSEVAIIGCDHSFQIKKEDLFSLFEATGQDQNHFITDYYKPGELVSPPNYSEMEYAYSLAKQAYEANGRIIYNCTENTKLDIFPLQSIETFLKSKKESIKRIY